MQKKKSSTAPKKKRTQKELAEIVVRTLGLDKTERLLAFMSKHKMKSINFGEVYKSRLKKKAKAKKKK